MTHEVEMNGIPSRRQGPEPAANATFNTIELSFQSDDGTELFGKLTTPMSPGPFPVVVCVQTAEAQTVDTRVAIGEGKSIDYMDVYRRSLAEMNVAFFSYEGRGVRMGSEPPRFVDIDRPLFNTSTLDNKVLDAMSAVRTVSDHPLVDPNRIVLLGASEGTLLAAATASRLSGRIKALVLQSVLTHLREALSFMFSDGMFMQHCVHWDADGDGVITRQEFEDDPKGIRRLIPEVEFGMFDVDGDSLYTMDDRRALSRPAVDAITAGHMETINALLSAASVVALPDDWAADHYAYPATWEFLRQLDMPIGFFHGEEDPNTPVDGARTLEQLALEEKKTNMEFHFFPGYGHDLGGLEYFSAGEPSKPHRAVFEFIRRHTAV